MCVLWSLSVSNLLIREDSEWGMGPRWKKCGLRISVGISHLRKCYFSTLRILPLHLFHVHLSFLLWLSNFIITIVIILSHLSHLTNYCSVYLSMLIYLSICLSVWLSISLSIYMLIYLSVCISLCLSLSPKSKVQEEDHRSHQMIRRRNWWRGAAAPLGEVSCPASTQAKQNGRWMEKNREKKDDR